MKRESSNDRFTVLELTVNHHAGTLSHVCGLLSRRRFDFDGIACLPMADGRRARIWLRVRDTARLDHLERQLRNLHDVHALCRQPGGDTVFSGFASRLSCG